MFAKKNIKLPIYTDKLNFGFEKDNFFKDEKLMSKGVIKESITEDDDNVVIVKEFISFDKTLRRKDSITIKRSEWEASKLGAMSKEEVNLEIIKLKAQLQDEVKVQNFEACSEISNKINVLEKMLII